MEVWYNPSCSKCRIAGTALTDAGVEYTERRYLDAPPTVAELEDVLARLDMEPWEIVRTGEDAAKELGLKDWPRDEANRRRWIEAMVENPKLIQRPIVVLDDGTAVIARDEEAVAGIVARGRE
ncbi:MAG TPA: arsenate reductase family protein [Mycobacteriales bacterium]|nr:arsenate reductase family protein [Mycobacteriales bacterium]